MRSGWSAQDESRWIIMKRNIDVSRSRRTPGQESVETGPVQECAAAVERATGLLVHGMEASDIPISELSEALARMAQTLVDIGTPLFGDGSQERMTTHPDRDLRVVRDAFARDIAVCIENLQFHDHLMQQLTKARDILTGLAGTELSAVGVPANESNLRGTIELF